MRQNRKGSRFLIGALVAAALSGCSTSREQPSAANANANVATPSEAAQLIAKKAKAKPAATRAAPPPEVLSKRTTATILAQIHQANLKEITISKLAQEKASSSEVRAYADQLVQDHTNADQMVVALAQKTGARLHDSSAGRHESAHSKLHESAHSKLVDRKLSSANGVGFDQLFLQQTSSDQEGCNRSARMPTTMT